MSKYLTIEQRETLAGQLHALIARLRAEIAEALRQRGTDEATGEAPGLANHLEEIDDDAVADLETSLEIAAVERDARELGEAEEALQRLHTLDYGTCVECREEIPYNRLHASPLALRCVRCQAEFERAWPRTTLHPL